jgi:hypothetical protein
MKELHLIPTKESLATDSHDELTMMKREEISDHQHLISQVV